MSHTLLRRLQAAHAFDPSPVRHDLGLYHVPFRDLVDASRAEDALIQACRQNEQIAVVGDSGSGKSSLVTATLGPLDPSIAPIVVSVVVEPHEVVAEPRAMFAHVARAIVGHAHAANLLSDKAADAELANTTDERRVGPPPGRSARFGFGLFGAQATADLTRQAEDRLTANRSAADVLSTIDQMLRIVQDQDLVPVLVFDDTYRWLAGDADRALTASFFGRALPALAVLPCSLVVAVHRRYLADVSLRHEIERVLETRIDLPRLPGPEAVAAVLASRVVVHLGEDVGVVIDDQATARLFELYSTGLGQEVRGILRTAHVALAEACDAGAAVIGKRHVDAAHASWDAP